MEKFGEGGWLTLASTTVVVALCFRIRRHYQQVTEKLAELYEEVRDLPWQSIKKIIWYGAGARLVANFSLGLVPFVGAFSNAITAIALTEHLGRWIDDYLEDPANPPPEITMASLKKTFADAVAKRSKKAA